MRAPSISKQRLEISQQVKNWKKNCEKKKRKKRENNNSKDTVSYSAQQLIR